MRYTVNEGAIKQYKVILKGSETRIYEDTVLCSREREPSIRGYGLMLHSGVMSDHLAVAS